MATLFPKYWPGFEGSCSVRVNRPGAYRRISCVTSRVWRGSWNR